MKRIMAVFLILSTLSFSGCWDSTETERLGVVTLMGIGLDKDKKIEITIQEIGEKNKSNFLVYNESGNTVSEAVEKIALNQHHRIYFGHTKVVILSEELVSDTGVKPAIDFFQRNSEIRPTTKLLISHNDQLTRILSTDLGFSSDTGTILEETLKNKKNTPNIMAININDFIQLMSTPGCEAYTSGISLKTKNLYFQNANSFSNKKEIFDFSNIAIFKDAKMTDWLTGDETQGLLWLKGNGAGTLISVPFGKENISSRIVKVKSSVKPQINKSNADIYINVSVVCNLEESQYIKDFLNEDLIKNIEETQNEKIKDEISAAINKSRDKAQDIFGFGKYIYADYPDYYKKNSSSYIHDLNIYINVNTTIRNIRINYKPLIKQ